MNKTQKIFLFCLSSFFLMAFSYTLENPSVSSTLAEDDLVMLLSNKHISLKVESNWANNVISSTFDEEDCYINIQTHRDVELIQVFNNNHVLMYQLPVQSKSLHFCLDDFELGKHKLGLFFENKQEMNMAYLTVRNK